MLNSGVVRYEVGANVDATSFGGIAAVHRLVTRLGLVQRIDEDLQLLKVHLPYHESDHVLNLAYNVACGKLRPLTHLTTAIAPSQTAPPPSQIARLCDTATHLTPARLFEG